MQFLIYALTVLGDLPLHCLYQDIAGEWEFSAGTTVVGLQDILTCGHSIPNHTDSMMKIDPHKVMPMQAATYTIELKLERHAFGTGLIAKMGKDTGYWTMVYDEGIEVRFPSKNMEFFAHFKFSLLNPSDKPVENGNWDHIGKYEGRVEGSAPPRGDIFLCKCNETSMGWYSTTIGRDIHRGCFFGKKKSKGPERKMQKAEGSVMYLDEANLKSTDKQKAPTPPDAKELLKKLELPKNLALLAMKQKNDPIIKTDPTFQTQPNHLNATLPLNFDWRDAMSGMHPEGDDLGKELDQGACGSCYAIAATLAFQFRVRVALLRKYSVLAPVNLSWRAPTQCSPYTEGCDGGFSFLVYRHFKEVGAPPLACDTSKELTAEALTQKCNKQCYDHNKFFVKDYGYVGGFSQGSTEETMMREIYNNGPVVVGIAVNAIPELYNGKEGKLITDFTNELIPKEPGVDDVIQPWLWTTHAIVAVGWGEVNGEKFWVVRNSWGADWGEKGYTLIRRGQNDAAIELEAEWATVDLEKSQAAVDEALKSGFTFGKTFGAKETTKLPPCAAPYYRPHVATGFLSKDHPDCVEKTEAHDKHQTVLDAK